MPESRSGFIVERKKLLMKSSLQKLRFADATDNVTNKSRSSSGNVFIQLYIEGFGWSHQGLGGVEGGR